MLAFFALPAAAPAQAPAGIPGVLAPGVGPALVQEGFTFTEGPVGAADGSLFFSDIPPSASTISIAPGKISVARENTEGANGIAFTKDGELVFAEGGGKRSPSRRKDGNITVLTEGAPGMPLMAPNDLIIDARGGVYYTDPGPFPPVPGRTAYVYYLPAGSKASIVIDARKSAAQRACPDR